MDNLDHQIRDSKILIVDDNATNVALLDAMLDEAGYDAVHSTTDPRLVLHLHREHEFDLILLDIRMPHMDGIQVMEQLGQSIRDDYLPILVLTAQTDAETRRRALDAGAKDFLTKPFEQWEVLLRIRNMLQTRAYYNSQRLRGDVLEEEVRKRTHEVRQTQLEIIRRLGRAGEYRDNETGAHVIRMSKACQLLALQAGLDARHAENILYASPMHDVGKIGVPDAILLKPGKLDPEEWEIMKSHVDIGGDILAGHQARLMTMARDIALTHHEKWDGSGYPNGLKGTDIPVEGRIAAICDVFDALTSERPYKKAWPLDEVKDFMAGQAGKHFDPDLLDRFFEILPEVVKLRDDYPDEE